ncbi:ABC transporter ATP-binding protein [Paenibacillus sp. CAA11]|uniref:ABC transporter ATP-binding protein n=1 Tax=Paenibacillus sp. CAA11 TaxID=1532905 RepID=UPI000D39A4D2|nr:ABC transporter ATP-binding protein [Paenibacillus sp. CAA11]AWB43855.1 ABC transporter ATP-binding protein [Paenibacillus sp. CAA11]
MIELGCIQKSFGPRKVLRELSWKVEPGQFWGILGPNGSGKTTLLNVISGVEPPDSGEIHIKGRPLKSYDRRSLSRLVAVLQQDGLPTIGYTVREVVEMGRFPYLNWLGRDQAPHADRLIEAVMDRLELLELADRPLNELSGGQRQRTALGKVMAQQPQLLLLDEPTTYLDVRAQLQFMELVSSWQREEGLTVIAVMHDLNLAALYCDHLLVLKEGAVAASGDPKKILESQLISDVFGVDSYLVPHPDSGVPQVMLRKKF